MSTPTSKPVLNPLLQAALSSLDISLEEELIRYRRLSKGSKPNFPQGNTLIQPPPTAETLDLSQSAEASPEIDSVSTTTEINSTTQLQPNSPQENAASNLVHQPTESEEKQNLAEPNNNQQPPEDYLESSEQLLRSLEENKSEPQKPEPQKTPAWKQVLFSPLGIGSVAVFVVASTLFGATLLDSQTANKLGLGFLFASEDSDVEVEPVDQAAIEGEVKASPSGPNLANNQEFTKELDLDTLSTVESGATPDVTATSETPAVAPSPIPAPNPAPQGGSSDSTEALIPRSIGSPTDPNAPTAVPNNIAAQPAPTNSVSQVPEAVPAPGTNEPYHFVIVDYTGADSLTQARTIVKDAYLREFGQSVKIQMSASNSEAEAQRLVDELKQRGISASIFANQ